MGERGVIDVAERLQLRGMVLTRCAAIPLCNFANGSKPEVAQPDQHVGSALKSGHSATASTCLFRAKRRRCDANSQWKRPPTETALLPLESLCGQPEQMKRFAGFVDDFQPPFGTVSKACDDVADELRAHRRTLVPCGVMIC